MYESRFQLRQRPFSTAPCVDDYFPADGIEQNRQALVQAIHRSVGPVLIIGSAGRGKTMLCQQLATHFKTRKNVAQISCSGNTTRREFLQLVSFALGRSIHGLEDGELQLNICEYLTSREVALMGTLFIIDDAHYLTTELLEEVQKISSLVRDGAWCVETAVAGTPKLEEALSHPGLESFHQRIAARCYVEPFARDETFGHITQQIARAGGDASATFATDAVEKIHEITGGTPRLINQLCDQALVMAAAGGRTRLDARGVQEAWATLQSLPIDDLAADDGEANLNDSSSPNDDVVEFGVLGETPVDVAPTTDATSFSDVNPTNDITTASDVASDICSFEIELDSTPHEPETAMSDAEVFSNIKNRLDTIETGISAAARQPTHTAESPEAVPAQSQSPAIVNSFFDDFDDEEVVADAVPAFRKTLGDQKPSVASSQGSVPMQVANTSNAAESATSSETDELESTDDETRTFDHVQDISATDGMVEEDSAAVDTAIGGHESAAGEPERQRPAQNDASPPMELMSDARETETATVNSGESGTEPLGNSENPDAHPLDASRERQLGSLFSKLPRN